MGQASTVSRRIGRRRTRHLEEIAEALPQRAAALSKIFLKRTSLDISHGGQRPPRSRRGPRRITELAGLAGVTQPAITLLVNRLQEREWVTREPDPDDRRAVRVMLSPAGAATFAQLQAEYRALLHEEMAALSDEDLEALAQATQVIDHLITRLED